MNPALRHYYYYSNNDELNMTYSSYTPTWTGFSAIPTVSISRYGIAGKILHLIIVTSASGTSNANTLTITLPTGITAKGAQVFNLAQAINNSANAVATGLGATRAGSNIMDFYLTAAGGVWTTSGGKTVSFNALIEIE